MEIAREYTDMVVESYWDDDFGAARNRALASAASEWVLSINADEIFDDPDSPLRERLVTGSADIYTVPLATRAGSCSPCSVRTFPRAPRLGPCSV